MKALAALVVSLLFWFVLYSNTLLSMVDIWWRSETFAHGFLIFPLSLYLIWLKKEDFFYIEKRPNLFFLLCLVLLVFIWGLAKSVDVTVVQQFTVILMLPLIVGSLFGFKLLKHYLFPLLYLLFAVPFGEFLVPKLQEYTAIMTVYGLQMTGVPVFTEGMFISIPEGDFEVAVACSGIRYLIASLALGTLYAYLTYTKMYKKIIFITASFIVPIIANGFRAYGIVMIAHLSNMEYATGTDHLIYGWLFFGVVIFILFFIGSFWQDKEIESPVVLSQLMQDKEDRYSFKAFLPVIVLFIGPMMTYWMSYEPQLTTGTVSTPIVSAPWIDKKEKPEKWQPSFVNADSEVSTIYHNQENNKNVYFYSSEYLYESENKELINSVNEIFSTKRWLLVKKQTMMPFAENNFEELVVRNNSEKLLIWGWYEVLGLKLTNPIKIKIVQAFGKFFGTGRGGQFKAIAITFNDNEIDIARSQLKLFLQQNKAW